ncbi:hypothetical protein K437DRAFT_259485 [Tilletiaria anomala UBC 951]|uniref:C-CAP/cofactor C-like domain-containing protein n=1 Tax=Tilletiaria anomala (strain ATCC 24038 / CBS 436.72 / UBC 951) TaxID=1037660 RepID=A0A066VHG5_TILAU|nr:uncharacterized protein K437DRAFT_259485 [Tilletiaria anomala UBC 951]KDN38194.1 hypothetical protein K437DRAFT_259485 [Tilletiaria anomala UBC 951]
MQGIGAGSRADRALVFYERFNESISAAQKLVQNASSSSELTKPLQVVSQLRADVTEYHDLIPSYDRNTYENKLRQLAAEITAKRAELGKSSGRFSLRRAPKPQPASNAPSHSPSTKPDEGTSTPRLSASMHAAAAEELHSKPKRVFTGKKRARLTRNDAIFQDGTSSGDLHISDCIDCLIDLRPPPPPEDAGASDAAARTRPKLTSLQAVQLRAIKNSVLLLGEIDGSVMVHGCENCIIAVKSRQYRMHTSESIIGLIDSASVITIEHCSNLALAPCPSPLRKQRDASSPHSVADPDSHLNPTAVTNAPSKGKFEVQDFDHISRATASPSWILAKPDVVAKVVAWTAEQQNPDQMQLQVGVLLAP